jgi:hypothetical protein
VQLWGVWMRPLLGNSVRRTQAQASTACQPSCPSHCAQVKQLPMLVPHAPRLQQLIEQLAACLHALAGMVRQEQPPDRCAPEAGLLAACVDAWMPTYKPHGL